LHLVDEFEGFSPHVVGETGIDDALNPRGFDVSGSFGFEFQDGFCGTEQGAGLRMVGESADHGAWLGD